MKECAVAFCTAAHLLAAVIGFNRPSLQISCVGLGWVILCGEGRKDPAKVMLLCSVCRCHHRKRRGNPPAKVLMKSSPPPVFERLPSSSCVQGRCVVTVQLTEEEVAADDGGVDYFLFFVGSTQQHLTSTLRSNHDTLQALCPGKPPHSFTAVQTTTFNPAELHSERLWPPDQAEETHFHSDFILP